MPFERRKYPRIPEEMVFAIQGGPLLPDQVAQGAIVDISEGGVAFESEAEIPVGQVIAFELRLPIHVQAKILHSERRGERHRYGMEFEKVEWLDRETLRRYIKRKLGLAPYDSKDSK